MCTKCLHSCNLRIHKLYHLLCLNFPPPLLVSGAATDMNLPDPFARLDPDTQEVIYSPGESLETVFPGEASVWMKLHVEYMILSFQLYPVCIPQQADYM